MSGDIVPVSKRAGIVQTCLSLSPKYKRNAILQNDSAAASVAGAPSKYANMKILELRKILSEQGLPTSGSAEEMRQRLAAGDGRSETDSAVAAPNHSTRKYDNMEVSETVSAVSAPNYSTRKYDNMKVLILRQELNKRALGMSGSVDEMRQRLAEDDARSEKVADPQQVVTTY